MNEIIQKIKAAHIKDLKKRPAKNSYNLAQAMTVDEVIELSLAEELGIKKGDMLIDINGRPAAEKDLWQWTKQSSQHTLIYWLKHSNEELLLETSGIPLGHKINRTSEAILESFLSGKGENEDLCILWERYEWDALEKIDQYFQGEQKKAEQQSGFLSKLLGGKPNLPSPAAWFFQGVSRFEAGNYEDAMTRIREFHEEDASSYTMNYTAMVLYYYGRNELRLGNQDNALDYFLQSYDYNEQAPVKKAIQKLGAEVPDNSSDWVGKQFPLNYELPSVFDAKKFVSLEQELEALDQDQTLQICLLADYRNNGPYSAFINSYMIAHQYFPLLFPKLHVITAKTEGGYWGEAEAEALDKGLDISVLHDPENHLPATMQITCCPTVYLLNHKGEILHDEFMESNETFARVMKRLLER